MPNLPLKKLRSEPAIIAGIAKATVGKRLTVNWDDLTVNYAKIRDSIARVIPVFRRFQRADSRGLLSSATLCPRSQRIPKPAAQGEGHRWTAAGAVCRPDQSLQRRGTGRPHISRLCLTKFPLGCVATYYPEANRWSIWRA